ncbi:MULTISPECIES: hypothetical protein [Nostocales]|nr:MULTISPECIES: hypothetical protein [Nostocales]
MAQYYLPLDDDKGLRKLTNNQILGLTKLLVIKTVDFNKDEKRG